MPTRKSQVHKYYFDNPEVWEKIRSEKIKKECKFLDYIFKKYGEVNSILDVGCGTGFHLELFRKMGYKGFGIDLNSKMIKFAKSNYPKIPFQVRDMKNLKFKNEFDAVICLCTTFSYNTINRDVIKSLKCFNNALRTNGVLVIETFNPISFLQKIKFNGSFFLEKEEVFNKLNLKSEIVHVINERKQTITETKTFYNLQNNKKLKTDITEYRLFFPQEMKLFLEQAGFKLLDIFGGYNKIYKNPDGTKLITVSKKNSSRLNSIPAF